MRLYRPGEVPDDEYGMLCRQSRFAGVVRLIIWCGVPSVAPIFGWRLGKPLLLWMGLGVAAIVIWVALRDLATMFRATNWLLRIGSDGVWINLRSYRDKDIDIDVLSVMHLKYSEIASIGRHTESYTTPSETATGPGSYGKVGGSTVWRDEFLEIQLSHDQTKELITALNELRFPQSPAESPAGPVRVKGRISPLWLADASLLRIGWVSVHGPAVLPRLATALTRLDGSVPVAEPTRRERPDWRQLTPEGAIELARELVHVHAATIEATALLVRAGGMSYGDASAQIQQFEEQRIV